MLALLDCDCLCGSPVLLYYINAPCILHSRSIVLPGRNATHSSPPVVSFYIAVTLAMHDINNVVGGDLSMIVTDRFVKVPFTTNTCDMPHS